MAAVLFIATVSGDVQAADMKNGNGGSDFQVGRDSVLRIPANAAFPLNKRLGLGVGRSIIVQSPVPLKDVLVSDPTRLDAVVQSSDRVFLIAKQSGQTNAFFFDEYGQQILTLEVAIGADLSALDEFLARLIPGSSIHSEIAGKAVVLTGTVRTPIDSNRAAQIAAQFVGANSGSLGNVNASQSPLNALNNAVSTTGAGGATSAYGQQTQSDTSAVGGTDDPYGEKPVINLITVEGEEQVMLRVSVAEVQRSILKQFGINIGALLNSGNFQYSVLSDNNFPLNAVALGTLPTPGIATLGSAAGLLQLYNEGPASPSSPFGNSGVTTAWQSGNQAVAGARGRPQGRLRVHRGIADAREIEHDCLEQGAAPTPQRPSPGRGTDRSLGRGAGSRRLRPRRRPDARRRLDAGRLRPTPSDPRVRGTDDPSDQGFPRCDRANAFATGSAR
jgi:pilus assembly protein CpaC